MDLITVGKRVRRLRMGLGINQKELGALLVRDAIKSGRDVVSQSEAFISRLENGRGGELKMEDVRALARVLDTHVGYILDGEDPNLARAVEAFGSSESLSKAITDIANFYQSATASDRASVAETLEKVAVWCRGRYAGTSTLEQTLASSSSH